MKSNDIIEAANLFLKDKRGECSKSLKGHFVLRIQTENKLGHYKRYCYKVFFVNKDCTPWPVGDACLILPVEDGHEEANYKIMDIELTRLMFTILNTQDWLEHFILGNYGISG